MRSKTITGVASTARLPNPVRLSTLPSDGSASSSARQHVGDGEVRRSRAARFETGRPATLSPIGSRPSAHHSARIGIASPVSPSRMKQREPPIARPVSVTASARDRVEIVDGANAARDLGDEPLAPEGLVEGRSRPGAVERDRRLSRQRLHQAQIVRAERPPLGRRCGHHHSDHVFVDDQRHERGALRACGLASRGLTSGDESQS